MAAASTEIIARAVIRRDHQILLARERASSWSFLPGGHVEPGERVEAALIRELAEELGTNDATITRFLGAVEYGYTAAGIPHHEINLVFDVDLVEADPVSQADHIEFHWLPVDQLGDAEVRPESLKQALLVADEWPFWRGWPA
ncbi:MAG: NUDIX domain-containing protein [Actinophytocola sp.]|nr:NUDIX domain-containing protein [Actinophytocola sp.]